MAHRTRSRVSQQRKNGTGIRYPSSPHDLTHRPAEDDAAYDAELAAALRAAREVLGDEHPLVADALRSLRQKERQRTSTEVDSLTAALGKRPHRNHEREEAVARMLGEILHSTPDREVHIPGGGHLRADMLFLDHRLVVEENGSHHTEAKQRKRDARLAEVCRRANLQLLTIWAHEPLTVEHLKSRLSEVGIAA